MKVDFRQRFEALGLEGWEYVCRKDRFSHIIRCLKCGTETAKDIKPLFSGKRKTLQCRKCGNGTKAFSDFADKVLAYYSDKHTQEETLAKFGISKNQLQGWVKRRGVTNGRTVAELNAEKARKAADATLAEREKRVAEKVKSFGFEYLGGYKNTNGYLSVRCRGCGEVTNRSFQTFKDGTATCKTCRHNETVARQEAEKKERETERAYQKALQALINPLRLSPYQIERQKELDKKRTCIVCGNAYTIRLWQSYTGVKNIRESGYCSPKCQELKKKERNKEYRKLHKSNDNYRARARKFGCEYDKTVTKKAVFKKFGLKCALCGEMCDPEDHEFRIENGKKVHYTGLYYPTIDHIIPMAKRGGHTWDNVQVAHMICNSRKETTILEELDNGKKENHAEAI